MRELTTPTGILPVFNVKFAEWLGIQTFNDPALEKLVVACEEWALAFRAKAQPRWLSLIGRSGTGKTHCAEKLWRMALGKSDFSKTAFVPQVIYWPDFIQQLRGGNGYALRDDAKTWPVLLLDDIGAERDPSGYAAEELNTLLGCRMNKWTLITSNKTLESLKAIDARIASRLVRGQNICVEVNTQDFAERQLPEPEPLKSSVPEPAPERKPISDEERKRGADILREWKAKNYPKWPSNPDADAAGAGGA